MKAIMKDTVVMITNTEVNNNTFSKKVLSKKA